MSQPELVKLVVELLQKLGRGGMLTGSLASSFYGEPRSTHDVDFVVELTPDDLPTLLSIFSAEKFYLSEAAARDAIRDRRMFNILDIDSGDKVDLWMLTDSPFDQSRFSRRTNEDFGGIQVPVCSPEDSILAKLDWAKQSGGSEKQRLDALHVLELQHAILDFPYLDHWAKELGVVSEWEELKRQAEPLP